MNTKSASLQVVTLKILGKNRPSMRKKVFDSKDFILPNTHRETKTRKEKMEAWDQAPTSERQIQFTEEMGMPNPFHHLAKAIDTSQLMLSSPHKGIKIKVEDFRKEAMKAAPEGTKIGVAFDTYAKAQYEQSYSDLVSDARNKVIARFKAAFVKNLDYHQMSDEYHNDKDIFLHQPVWASKSSIQEYKSLAKQGHVYSQYMAGLLLASSAGGYKAECVEYLLMAYENKQPEAMRVLAEFLNFKNDYYGAVQCALLSTNGGDGYSKEIVRKALGNASHQMMQTNHGIVPLSYEIIETLHANGFDSILREHFSYLIPDPHPETRIASSLQGGRS
ncbi:hypothetical protein [Vreelandella titanicae]|uniref:Uncharacterized protein n=1 Tax=Vreelandella titanicae TaxID=664683 RepID=A0A558J718_9GAMM|nr:hypothetical protein [Halomonas titanicae]TVU89393.1 hypothetical protein FQP89_15485 [Halomonas titanicae]